MARVPLAAAVLVSLCALLLLPNAWAKTVTDELVDVSNALDRTPGYKYFGKYATTYLSDLMPPNQRGDRGRWTLLCPSDTAMNASRGLLSQYATDPRPIVRIHMLPGAMYTMMQLTRLQPGATLATLAPRRLTKISARGALRVTLRGKLGSRGASITTPIYGGEHIVVYGMDRVLAP